MEQARLEAQLREVGGKGAARALRREGFVPAIVYGHKLDPMAIQLPERGLSRFLGSSGENVIINLDLARGEPETVMLKEVQIHPVSRRILHADFVRVSLEERVTTHIPITLTGASPGVAVGGIQEFLLRELQIECEVGKLPEHIELDVSSLEIGDQIRVSDVELPEDMNIVDDPVTIIVTIATPTIIAAEEEEEEEGVVLEEEVEMEPEVIGEKREEEEVEED
jgi:large subunit ribosomal protein L25